MEHKVNRFSGLRFTTVNGPKPHLLYFLSLTLGPDVDKVKVDDDGSNVGLMWVICPSSSLDLGSTYSAIQWPDVAPLLSRWHSIRLFSSSVQTETGNRQRRIKSHKSPELWKGIRGPGQLQTGWSQQRDLQTSIDWMDPSSVDSGFSRPNGDRARKRSPSSIKLIVSGRPKFSANRNKLSEVFWRKRTSLRSGQYIAIKLKLDLIRDAFT